MAKAIFSDQLHLREWREFRELSLEAVAEKLGAHHSTVLRWEKGKVKLTPSQIEALANIYQCTAAELALPPEDRARGQLLHRIMSAANNLSEEDLADAASIIERMPSARRR